MQVPGRQAGRAGQGKDPGKPAGRTGPLGTILGQVPWAVQSTCIHLVDLNVGSMLGIVLLVLPSGRPRTWTECT